VEFWFHNLALYQSINRDRAPNPICCKTRIQLVSRPSPTPVIRNLSRPATSRYFSSFAAGRSTTPGLRHLCFESDKYLEVFAQSSPQPQLEVAQLAHRLFPDHDANSFPGVEPHGAFQLFG